MKLCPKLHTFLEDHPTTASLSRDVSASTATIDRPQTEITHSQGGGQQNGLSYHDTMTFSFLDKMRRAKIFQRAENTAIVAIALNTDYDRPYTYRTYYRRVNLERVDLKIDRLIGSPCLLCLRENTVGDRARACYSWTRDRWKASVQGENVLLSLYPPCLGPVAPVPGCVVGCVTATAVTDHNF